MPRRCRQHKRYVDRIDHNGVMMEHAKSVRLIRITQILGIISFILFLIFKLFFQSPRLNTAIFSLIDAIFFLTMGFLMLILAIIAMIKAWTLSSDRYDQWLLSISLWGRLARRGFTGNLSPSYRQRQDRLLMPLVLLFGLFICATGTLTLWENIQICMTQQCIW